LKEVRNSPGQTAITAEFTLAADVRRAHAESPMGAGVTSSTGSTTGGFDWATAGRKKERREGEGGHHGRDSVEEEEEAEGAARRTGKRRAESGALRPPALTE
jgi:hypothetical protein